MSIGYSDIENVVRENTPAEVSRLLTKRQIWPEPNWEKLKTEHPEATVEGLYGLKQIYKAIPNHFPLPDDAASADSYEIETAVKQYLIAVTTFRKYAESMPLDFSSAEQYQNYWKDKLMSAGFLDENGNPCYGKGSFSHSSEEVRRLYPIDLWIATMNPYARFYQMHIEQEQFLVPKDQRTPRGYSVMYWTDGLAAANPQVTFIKPGEYLFVKGSRGKQTICAKLSYPTKEEAIKGCREWLSEKRKDLTHATPLQKLKNFERSGLPDYRKGRNVSSREICDTFHLMDIKVGKGLGNAEAQLHLNHLYDSLYDLSAVLKLDPSQIGLDSHLSFELGSGASRGASGTYRTITRNHDFYGCTISLSRKNIGILGHEYMHALDYYLHHKLYPSEDFRDPMSSSFLPSATRLVDSMMHKQASEEVAKRVKELRQKQRNHSIQEVRNDLKTQMEDYFPDETLNSSQKQARVRAISDFLNRPSGTLYENEQYLRDHFSTVRKQLIGRPLSDVQIKYLARERYLIDCKEKDPEDNSPVSEPTEYYKEAVQGDSVRRKNYLVLPNEMFARAGHAWISEKLKEIGAKNDYLALDKPSMYLPVGQERAEIDRNFDAFFQDMRARELFPSVPGHAKPRQIDGIAIDCSGQFVPFSVCIPNPYQMTAAYKFGNDIEHQIPIPQGTSLQDLVSGIVEKNLYPHEEFRTGRIEEKYTLTKASSHVGPEFMIGKDVNIEQSVWVPSKKHKSREIGR